VTAGPHTPNSGPRKALYASLAASTPAAGISGGSDAPRDAHAGAHGFGSERKPPDAAATRHTAPKPYSARTHRHTPTWAQPDSEEAA